MSATTTGQKRSRRANAKTQAPAEQANGVSHQSIAISSLFERVGRDSFVALATEFHDRVYSDPDPKFRGLFAGIPKDVAIANQSGILIERMGGPAEFSKRQKRTPVPSSVSASDQQQQQQRRVQSYNQRVGSVNEKSAAMWLNHMLGALESIDSIDAQSKLIMLAFFKQAASRLVQKVKAPRPAPVFQGAAQGAGRDSVIKPQSAPLMSSASTPTIMAPSYAYAAPPPPGRTFVPPHKPGASISIDATPPYGPIVAAPSFIDSELSGAALILKSASTGPVSDYLRPHVSEESLGAKMSYDIYHRVDSPTRRAFADRNYSV